MPTLGRFGAEFGPMDVVSSVFAELTITRGVYATYATAHIAPLTRFYAVFRDQTSTSDTDDELGRMLAARVHSTIAAIPARFPCAPRMASEA